MCRIITQAIAPRAGIQISMCVGEGDPLNIAGHHFGVGLSLADMCLVWDLRCVVYASFYIYIYIYASHMLLVIMYVCCVSCAIGLCHIFML